ncbi:hypothetical protein M422DRAFT_783854 [Sphaerobolus stellatus SS14]|uniref:Uncharacterized protein n=1 Tax=Sphaerobolus stellatus (strain SS14) TaxID=990650 RepID=A0A0C9U9A5_SPHS4|nr:hypothetical protein M422DRAFT_783854 [Sphaerobolus stellatus SS14]
MEAANLQPYIHDTLMEVREGRNVYWFQVFYKRHCYLPINFNVQPIRNGIFRGDVVAMKVGQRQQYVNMAGRDVIATSKYILDPSSLDVLANKNGVSVDLLEEGLFDLDEAELDHSLFESPHFAPPSPSHSRITVFLTHYKCRRIYQAMFNLNTSFIRGEAIAAALPWR